MYEGRKEWEVCRTQQNSRGNQIQDIPQTGFFGHPRG
ncbi:hypothetical protein, partial [Staphylococcus aureus]